jgi:hypothetical protein
VANNSGQGASVGGRGPTLGGGVLVPASVPVPTWLGRGGSGVTGGGAEPATGSSMQRAGGRWLVGGSATATEGGSWRQAKFFLHVQKGVVGIKLGRLSPPPPDTLIG